MHVFEVMTRRVFSCRPHDTLATAASLMWEHDVGSLPVVGEDEEVVGMITDRDICMAAYVRGERLADVEVASVMSRGLHACGPDESVAKAEELMRLDRIRRTPVIDARGRLVGILSLADLAREAIHQKRCKHGEALDAEITTTLAAVSEPRAHRPGAPKEPS
ncbi:MAG TPA: CBS domain-containing protein [Polyangia bacterium]|nr:CBS domain-containing protein [Polyangia bacterium]